MTRLPTKITGYRVWRAMPVGLQPINFRIRVWSVGPQKSVCGALENTMVSRSFCKEPPEEGCHCGFNAYHTLESAMDKQIIGAKVIGALAGWGGVTIHPDGWRSEWAEPIALMIYEGEHSSIGKTDINIMLAQLAKDYRIPLVESEFLPVVMSEYGEPVPKEIIDEKWKEVSSERDVTRHGQAETDQN